MFASARGTSGSGKTTLARLALRGEGVYGPAVPVHVPRRKQPFYYTRERLDGGRGLAVLGHYESPTGGCDTISGNQLPFDLFRNLDAAGYDVFCEGLLHSAEQHRTAGLHHEGHDVRLFYFDVPLQVCLDSVVERRLARGNTAPLNPHTTASRHRALRYHPSRFYAMGVKVTVGGRLSGVRWLIDIGLATEDGARGMGLLP